jgi:exopolysaccharide biosynthesis WecB/TagA/CpsF family protein
MLAHNDFSPSGAVRGALSDARGEAGRLPMVSSVVPTVVILGVPVARLDSETALAEVERLCEQAEPATLFYVNAHSLNVAYRDPEYLDLLQGADLVLNDGAGLSLAARMYGRRFSANLNGSDFNPRILELAARRGWTVFLLGAEPGVAERAARRLRERIPDLEIAGSRDGYFSSAEAGEVVRDIKSSGAHVLMVAMGNPQQEKWVRDHLHATGARLGIGVGAFFDFAAGEVRRAPAWMNRVGVEWIFRLVQEPRRMWRRYLIGNVVFLFRVGRDRFTRPR